MRERLRERVRISLHIRSPKFSTTEPTKTTFLHLSLSFPLYFYDQPIDPERGTLCSFMSFAMLYCV